MEKSRRKCPYSWFPEAGWEDAIRLSEEFPDKFSSLMDDIERNEKIWKKVRIIFQCLFHINVFVSPIHVLD